jgi:O-succinylbenzoic acid--CoA ligase
MEFNSAEAFLELWKNGQSEFTLSSSGSTGAPKPIQIERKWMEWSALQTAKYLKPRPDDKIKISLPLNKVGGIMMLVRALVWKIDYEIQASSVNPLLNTHTGATILSLTPHQLHHVLSNPISKDNFLKYREVLIGGAEMPYQLEKAIEELHFKGNVWQTYGMTETISHIALRNISSANKTYDFQAFDEVRIEQDEEACAILYTPFYPNGLKTNDIIEKISEKGFKIIGRKDFIINTGSVKIQPEMVEKLIQENLNESVAFVVSSLKDKVLGEKVVLVTEDALAFEDFDWTEVKAYNKYAVPKEVIEIKKLPVNEGAKLDRRSIKAMLETRNQ